MRLPLAACLFSVLGPYASGQCTYNSSWYTWAQYPGNGLPTTSHTVTGTEWNNKTSHTFSGNLTIGDGTTTSILYFDCGMSTSLTCDGIIIKNAGKLVIGALTSGNTINITCNYIVVEAGGEFHIGSTTSRPQGQIVITLAGSARVFQVHKGGTLELHGAQWGDSTNGYCWTQLASNASANATSLQVELNMNWPANKQIVIAATDFASVSRANPPQQPRDTVLHQTEVRTLQSSVVDATTMQITPALTYGHYGSNVETSIRVRAEVALLDRSIRIQGSSSTALGQVKIGEGSSSTAPTVHIDWTEFTDLGHDTLLLGNYPLHFHELGDMDGSYVKHCSLHHNVNNNLVIHDTQKLYVFDNVFYHTKGWHIWMEDPDQTKPYLGNNQYGPKWKSTGNVIDRNLALLAKDRAAGTAPWGQSDNAACYYIRNFENTFINNHAGSSDFSGFYVDTIEFYSSWSGWLGYGEYHPFNNGESFVNNVAHTCAEHGFYMVGYTEFQVKDPDASAPNDPRIFEGFTAYKNNGLGFHCRNFGTVKWLDPKLTDNGCGVYFASAGRWESEFRAVQALDGAIIVGESGNTGLSSYHTRSLPSSTSALLRDFPYIAGDGNGGSVVGELTGLSMYDGVLLINDTTFKGFSTSSQHASRLHVGAFGTTAYDSPWAMDARNIAKNCTFDTGSNRVRFRSHVAGANGVHNTILEDYNGTVITSSNPGAIYSSVSNILNVIAPDSSPTNWVAGYKNNTFPFGQALLYSNVSADATITVGSASDTVYDAPVPDLGMSLHPWNTLVATSASQAVTWTNRVSFNGGGNASGTMVVMLSGNAQGSIADFEIPWVFPAGHTTLSVYSAKSYADAVSGTNGTALTAASSFSVFQSSANTGYFHTTPMALMHVRIVLPASTTLTGLSTNWGSTFTGQPVYVRIASS